MMARRKIFLNLFCGTLLLGAPNAFAAIAYVQSTSLDTSGTSTTLQFTTQNCTAGSTLIVGLRVGDQGSTITVSDDTNGTWPAANVTQIDTAGGGGDTLYIFHFDNSQAVNKATITVSKTGVSTTLRFGIYEFTGLASSASLDKTASTNGTSAVPPDSGATATTTQANELFFGVTEVGSGSNTFTAGTNVAWILKETPPSNGSGKYAGEYYIASSTQAADAQFTIQNADGWAAGVATFKAASGSPIVTKVLNNITVNGGLTIN